MKNSLLIRVLSVKQTKCEIVVEYIGHDNQSYHLKLPIEDLEQDMEADDSLEAIDRMIHGLCSDDYREKIKRQKLVEGKNKALKYSTTLTHRGQTIPIRVTKIEHETLYWQFRWADRWENGFVHYGFASAIAGRSIYDKNGLTENAQETIEDRTKYYVDQILKQINLEKYLKLKTK